MITRSRHLRHVAGLLARFPVVGLVGPRQVGKSTLAHQVRTHLRGPATFLDMEIPEQRARLADPWLALSPLRGLVVIDEVQHVPEIFSVLRPLADRPGKPARFLLLGSASPELFKLSADSLAGRIAYHELEGLDVGEIGSKETPRLWLRGGFPRSYLADSDADSASWRREFVQTFLERELPRLGVTLPAETLRRFWTMLAHWHGQIWNASQFASSFGVSDKTVERYLDLLSGAFVARRLQPWHENIEKRQVKAPKVYVKDSGLLHTLLNLTSQDDLDSHPKVGASWEGFALAETAQRLGARREECFFWATHSGAELDLLVVRGKRRLGFEFKRTTAPKVTPSMKVALTDLRLESLDVLHAGEETFPLGEKIRAVAMSRLWKDVRPLA